MGRSFVIWADCLDREYRLNATDARYRVPVGVEVITIVEDCDLKVMMDELRKKINKGWTPARCRVACEVD